MIRMTDHAIQNADGRRKNNAFDDTEAIFHSPRGNLFCGTLSIKPGVMQIVRFA